MGLATHEREDVLRHIENTSRQVTYSTSYLTTLQIIEMIYEFFFKNIAHRKIAAHRSQQ